MIEHGNGVVHCGDGAVINLLEVCLAGGDLRRIDVEGNDVFGETQRIQAGVSLVHLALDRFVT